MLRDSGLVGSRCSYAAIRDLLALFFSLLDSLSEQIIKVADVDTLPTSLAILPERTSSFLIIPAKVLKLILPGELHHMPIPTSTLREPEGEDHLRWIAAIEGQKGTVFQRGRDTKDGRWLGREKRHPQYLVSGAALLICVRS